MVELLWRDRRRHGACEPYRCWRDIDEVVAGLEGLPVTGWHIEVAKTTRAGVAASQLLVEIDPRVGPDRAYLGDNPGDHRPSPPSARTRQNARPGGVRPVGGRRRATAWVAPEEVHFHEVGGLDAIVDVVGTCLALESLDVGSVRSGPVALGVGTVGEPTAFCPTLLLPSSSCSSERPCAVQLERRS